MKMQSQSLSGAGHEDRQHAIKGPVDVQQGFRSTEIVVSGEC